ncbi:MAG: hypothetical protein CVT86_08485, partial [Alphaproteobacteria bacterium HGW-Alphaproteobacteria-8]
MLFQVISSPNHHYGICNGLIEWPRRDLGHSASDDFDRRHKTGHAHVATRSIARAALTDCMVLAIDGRTTQHAGYALSQRCRKKIEEPFGWAKTVG